MKTDVAKQAKHSLKALTSPRSSASKRSSPVKLHSKPHVPASKSRKSLYAGLKSPHAANRRSRYSKRNLDLERELSGISWCDRILLLPYFSLLYCVYGLFWLSLWSLYRLTIDSGPRFGPDNFGQTEASLIHRHLLTGVVMNKEHDMLCLNSTALKDLLAPIN